MLTVDLYVNKENLIKLLRGQKGFGHFESSQYCNLRIHVTEDRLLEVSPRMDGVWVKGDVSRQAFVIHCDSDKDGFQIIEEFEGQVITEKTLDYVLDQLVVNFGWDLVEVRQGGQVVPNHEIYKIREQFPFDRETYLAQQQEELLEN